MKCHKCSTKTKVIDSRLVADQMVYRRRKCPVCKVLFTTYEERNIRPSTQ